MTDCRIPVKTSDMVMNISMSDQIAIFTSGSQLKENRLVGSRILNYTNLSKEHLDKIHKA